MPINNPVHPGIIMRELLIDDSGAGLYITTLAELLGISRVTLSQIINGHLRVRPEMALRLSKLLPNTDMAFWLRAATVSLFLKRRCLMLAIEDS